MAHCSYGGYDPGGWQLRRSSRQEKLKGLRWILILQTHALAEIAASCQLQAVFPYMPQLGRFLARPTCRFVPLPAVWSKEALQASIRMSVVRGRTLFHRRCAFLRARILSIVGKRCLKKDLTSRRWVRTAEDATTCPRVRTKYVYYSMTTPVKL